LAKNSVTYFMDGPLAQAKVHGIEIIKYEMLLRVLSRLMKTQSWSRRGWLSENFY